VAKTFLVALKGKRKIERHKQLANRVQKKFGFFGKTTNKMLLPRPVSIFYKLNDQF
jgi:hypothetical protein